LGTGESGAADVHRVRDRLTVKALEAEDAGCTRNAWSGTAQVPETAMSASRIGRSFWVPSGYFRCTAV